MSARGRDEAGGRTAPAGETPAHWLTIAVAALITAVTALVLGPPLAEVMEREPLELFDDPILEELVAPEPTELARFLIVVAGAFGAAAWIAFGPRPVPPALRGAARVAAVAVPIAVVAGLVVAWLARSEPAAGVDRPDYFSTLAGIAALALAGAIVAVAVNRPPGWRALGRLRRRGWTAPIAVVLTVCFLLPGVFTDSSLPDALSFINVGHLPGIFSDFTAVGNGATPGVDFAAQYSSLLPLLLAPPLALTDYSPGAFTIFAGALSAVALLSLWRALVLLSRSELAGIALYVPVLAIACIPLITVGDERLANNSQYQLLPERYLVPCLLAWLVARHLRGLAPTRRWTLFALAGLGVINNPEFGTPAFAATLVALALAEAAGPAGPSRLRELGRLAGAAAAGAGVAVCAVVAVDLMRSGSVPDPSLLTYYARLFGSQGFGMIPMPGVGLHWALYATFAGALLLAAHRSRLAELDRVAVGILAWAGAFGLLAGAYYAGRSLSYSLIGLFPAWGFALAVLAWAVWLRIDRAPDAGAALRRAGPLGVAALVGFGLAATAVADLAAPWSQVARIADRSERPSTFDLEPAERFVAETDPGGAPIVFIGQNGHLIARGAGVRNVSEIGDPIHVIAPQQLDEMLAQLEEQGGDTVYTQIGFNSHRGVQAYLRSHGFSPVARIPELRLTAWRRSEPNVG